MTTNEIKDQARAILATKRKVLTGGELSACEWALSETFEDDSEFIETTDDDDYEDLTEQKKYFYDILSRKVHMIELLAIQFSKEIGEWINSNPPQENE